MHWDLKSVTNTVQFSKILTHRHYGCLVSVKRVSRSDLQWKDWYGEIQKNDVSISQTFPSPQKQLRAMIISFSRTVGEVHLR